MPCGRYGRSRGARPFQTVEEYERHRKLTMRMILGPDWEDGPLAELVARYPQLQRHQLWRHLIEVHTIGGEWTPFELMAQQTPKPRVLPVSYDLKGAIAAQMPQQAQPPTVEVIKIKPVRRIPL